MTSPSATPLTHTGMIEAQRQAFAEGMHYQITAARMTPREAERYAEIAKRRYPMTKTVPRVVTVTATNGERWAYRIVNGSLQRQHVLGSCCPHGHAWEDSYNTPDIARTILDLFANPTEEVSDDD